jgi:CheY-like chemotaxis protein
MVVDDDHLVLKTTSRVVRSLGFTVLPARDGREAIDIHAEHGDAIRFVLMDMVMPDMNGVEVVRKLRDSRADLPVIYASGYSDKTLRAEHDLGASPFLQKPFQRSELIAAVRRVLGD